MPGLLINPDAYDKGYQLQSDPTFDFSTPLETVAWDIVTRSEISIPAPVIPQAQADIPEFVDIGVSFQGWLGSSDTQSAREPTPTSSSCDLPSLSPGEGPVLPSRVPDPLSFPWRAVTALLVKFVDVAGVDAYFLCSGTLLGPHHVLTAGHCVYNHDIAKGGGDSSQGWTREVIVVPGQTTGTNGKISLPFGGAQAVRVRSFRGWLDGDFAYDMAVITLDRDIGLTVGWMGLSVPVTKSKVLSLAGYPGGDEALGIPEGNANQYQWPNARVEQYLETGDLGVVEMHAITVGGSSGGPWYSMDPFLLRNSSYHIQAVHSYARSDRPNSGFGIMLTTTKATSILRWLTTDQ
eukprot:jgi/Mesvir1/22714/Mv14125-RA.1